MIKLSRAVIAPARIRPALARRVVLLALLTAVSLAALASTAGAIVTTIGPVKVGVQPRPGGYTEGPGGYFVGVRLPGQYANASGNPVVHGSNTWTIFWDPTDHYHGDWQNLIDQYMADAAGASGSLASVFDLDAQYTDLSNRPASYRQVFHGGTVDTHAYPASECTDPNPFKPVDLIGPEVAGEHTAVCLTPQQIEGELESFLANHALPKGMGNIYYVLTPPGVTVCLDGGGAAGHCSNYAGTSESFKNSFCSYHGDINPGGLSTGDGSTILYGVIPWVAGGYGDLHLLPEDEMPGWECQDAGIDPTSNPVYEPEQAKERNEKEQEEFEKLSPEQKRPIEEAEILAGPHEQEPNQQECPTSDGGCDFGLADLIISQLGLEQQNIVTDPLLNGWQDPSHYENTDECRFKFAPVLGGSVTAKTGSLAGTLFNQQLVNGKYYINDGFNLAALLLPYPGVECLIGTTLDPKFTAPSPVNSQEIVVFNGMESDITQNAQINFSSGGSPQANYATYKWNFGDGSPEVTGFAPGAPPCESPWASQCASTVFHAYTYGGTYEVTLTVTDVAGHVATTTHQVTVAGPPPPSSGSGAGAGGAGAAASGAGGPGSHGAGSVPAPVASAVILSKGLKTALKKGLAVRYSVNEQVAGRFEVLLNRNVARRLKISGTPAVGLAAGAAPQLVIAKAILVTTKGGRSTVHILFSKKTAARLGHTRKLSLMLRMIVRNAASSSPLTTTVLSTATLAG